MNSSIETLQIAVDIGNSGLRVVRLPNNVGIDLPEPLRINWELSSDTSIPAKRSNTTQSCYKPADSTWTQQISKLIDLHSPTCWWISSVNRPACEVLVGFLSTFAKCKWKVIQYQDLPLTVDVDYPERVGIDRLLASMAACRCVSADRSIVIQAGSAVTVDLVERYPNFEVSIFGKFLGGAILPGVPMMLRLLGKAADLLPELDADELVNLPTLPGRNTESAMLAGASSCLVGGVQHVVGRYRQKFNERTPIVISGGDGPLLVPHLAAPVHVVPHLVLQGILLLSRLR